jgi:hypothetical protein
MDPARQALRFSIPGSLLILWALVCFLLFRRCQGVSFLDSSALVGNSVGALVAILATIPIGFVVYQAYYFGYRPVVRFWPLPWGGRFVRLDRGSQILHELQGEQVEALEEIFETSLDVTKPYNRVTDPGPWLRHPRRKLDYWTRKLELRPEWMAVSDRRERRRRYEARWHENWDVLRAILDISGSVKGSGQIKQEYTILSDLYHALGATRKAVAFGWGLVVFLAVVHLGRIERHPAGLALISALTLAVSLTLHATRRRTWKSASASLKLGLRWLFSMHADAFAPRESKKERRRRERRWEDEPAAEPAGEETWLKLAGGAAARRSGRQSNRQSKRWGSVRRPWMRAA